MIDWARAGARSRGKQTELKKKGLPWTLAKSFCGAAQLTPFAPLDGSFELSDVAFQLDVNGAVKQSGHVNQMIFDVPFMLRYINSFAPLLPGDLVFTGGTRVESGRVARPQPRLAIAPGTPEGVGPITQGDRFRLQFVRGPQSPAWEGVL